MAVSRQLQTKAPVVQLVHICRSRRAEIWGGVALGRTDVLLASSTPPHLAFGVRRADLHSDAIKIIISSVRATFVAQSGDERWKPAMPHAFILRSSTYSRRDYAAPLQLETSEFALMNGWGPQK
jgi:hypothetical protein